MNDLKLLKADRTHQEALFNWANDKLVREMAFSSNQIDWDEHCEWFEKKIADVASQIFVGVVDGGEPVGQIRFDWHPSGEFIVDVHLAPNKRRMGYGVKIIELGLDKMRGNGRGGNIVLAQVKLDNIASIRSFLRVGFVDRGEILLKGVLIKELVYRLEGSGGDS